MAVVASECRVEANRRVTRPLFLHPSAKVLLFCAALLPFLWLLYGAFANTLGVNPAEKLMRATGD